MNVYTHILTHLYVLEIDRKTVTGCCRARVCNCSPMSHTNESYRILDWFASRIWVSHLTQMQGVMSHQLMRHITEKLIQIFKNSRGNLSNKWVISYQWDNRDTHINVAHQTYEWHIRHIHERCHANEGHHSNGSWTKTIPQVARITIES